MSAQREMTLAEWCEQLYDGHRVNRELRELTARAEAAEQRVREVRETLGALLSKESAAMNLLAKWREDVARMEAKADPWDPEDWASFKRDCADELERALTGSGSAG